MAADDEDNEVDGDGATGNGATGDYGDINNYGDRRWTTTTNKVEVDGDGATGDDNEDNDDGGGDGATGYDDDDNFDGRRR